MDLPLPIRVLLWPLSLLYGLGSRCRVLLYEKGIVKSKRLKAPVISVGNLTVGGTGKTPMVIWLAKRFVAEGKRVAILTRGYNAKSGLSDEVQLMQSALGELVQFGVGPNRYETGSRLEHAGPVDLFLLDDGYQHLELERDVNLLLVDTSRPLRDERLLPAGRLREPKSAVSRADIVVFTRVDDQPFVKRAIQEFPQMPIFPAATQVKGYRLLSAAGRDGAALGPLPVQPVFAFCGIGNPKAFFSDLERWGNVVAGQATFRDHHRYSPSEIERIERDAARVSARSLVTTAKDAENIGQHRFSKIPAYVCDMELKIGDESQLMDAVKAKLGRRAPVEQ